ncbi:uncharacterized protein LOC143301717 [Babylonia areolata]|uniref:uncharacterized protein LOC143301717 n=1 Tax=Babylonia areolata TaxID=304850 RepID=UPI003FD6AA6E
MARISTMVLLVVLVAVLGMSQANWYGKRHDRADFLNFLVKRDNPSRDMDPEVALAAVDQVLQLYRQRKTNSLS